jgi:hypothetical protein
VSAAVVPDAGKKEQQSRPASPSVDSVAPVHSAGAASGLPRFLSQAMVNDPDDEYEREAAEIASLVVGNATSLPKQARKLERTNARDAATIDDADEGTPLPRDLRTRLERVLDADLRDVRVHAGPAASRAADAVEARAFAQGRHIWLSDRESPHDHRLLAHEATHVVQQTGGGRALPVRSSAGLPLFLQRLPVAVPPATAVERARTAEPPPPFAPVPVLPIPWRFTSVATRPITPGRERRAEPSESASDAARSPASPATRTDHEDDAHGGRATRGGAGEAAVAGAGAAATAAAGATRLERRDSDAEREEESAPEEATIPPEVEIATAEVSVPPPVSIPELDAEWPLDSAMKPESLPKQPEVPPQNAAPASSEKSKDGGQATPTPYSQDPEESARKTRLAATAAQRAYQELAESARNEQTAFIAHASDVMRAMTQRYELSAERIVRALASDQQLVDTAADRARFAMDSIAAVALQRFDIASGDTALAIEAAGRRSYGLINAGMARSAGQIEAVVSSLVAGHLGAFNGAIAATRVLAEVARVSMDAWSLAAPLNYPIRAMDYLEDAKNESRQARIPRLVAPEQTRLADRVRDRTHAWETSRDTTVCSLSCSFRNALTAQNDAMAAQGRSSVASALTNARRTLAEQTRQGRPAIEQMHRSFLAQVETQRRAAKSRLSSKARAALAGLRAETQAAIVGVQSAARAALPSYWRGVQGFEQSIANTASKSLPAVEEAAKRAPTAVLDGIRRTRASLDERLAGNDERHEHSVAEREDGQRGAADDELAQLDILFADQSAQAERRLDESIGTFVSAFNLLDGTVTRAAESWARPLASRMAEFIAAKRTEAATALTSLLTGDQPPQADGGRRPAPAGDGGPAPAPAEDHSCDHCNTEADAASADGGAAPAPAPGTASADTGPRGLTAQVDAELDYITQRFDLATLFQSQLADIGSQVESQLYTRAENVAHAFEGGFAGTVDEEGVIAALRGLTAVKGRALNYVVFPNHAASGTLDHCLRYYLDDDSDDYAAASAYLRGDAVTGARLELEDSLGTFNDDEDRIEAVMRALSPEQLAALGRDHADTMAEVRDALDGTDVEVFDALSQGNYALADAYRMRDAVNEARFKGDDDAVHSAIEQYTGAPREGDYRASEFVEMSADDRRREVVEALGGIVSDEDVAAGAEPGQDVSTLSNAERAAAYVTRETLTYVGPGSETGRSYEMRGMTGANRDLARALILNGTDSVEARASRIGVELQRSGDPDIMNLDRATFDAGFSSDLANASEEERAAHRRAAETRARVVMLAAQRYADGAAAPGDRERIAADSHDPTAPMNDARVTAARDRLIARLGERFGGDSLKRDLAAGLLTDARPSPATVARAMRLAQRGWGTNEEMLFRFTERMNRDEIAQMRVEYTAQTGNSLDADLGTFGEGGTFTELSGDDALRMERALRGVARTDQERLENAAFALQQQRRSAGGFGASLAEDTLANRVMTNTEHRLELLAGGPIAMTRRGELLSRLPNFNPQTGEYTGRDRDTFLATANVAQLVAEDYAKRIDAFADVFTTALAILGAVAAAVITVATGGAALPLIAAAVATGLASMAAQYAIKGGRYGWEQAGIDLGMTAVQALTAGIGAQLGAAAQVASKGAAAAAEAAETLGSLARIFTGNPVIDQIIIGGITGSISGLGGAVFSERTWEGGDPIGSLFDGLLRGAMSGAATATITQGIEALGRNGAAISARARELAAQGGVGNVIVGTLGRGVGAVGRVVGAGLNASAEGGMARAAGNIALRGVTRATISATSAIAGRSAEIAYDAVNGRYRGDIGDALVEMGEVGIRSALQGLGEGAGESFGQAFHNQRIERAAESINRTRDELGFRRLVGQELHSAAEDLVFLHTHGKSRDAVGRFTSTYHVATHGGITPTIATVHPEQVVVDQMRTELMRHVSPELHAEFGDVPLRVMPEAEFIAFTRSDTGRVVTIIENGQPVVVIREHITLAQLADEGPHLVQTREESTRARVERLAESTLEHWDSLDLDTQLDLYQNKIDLEIDAHRRIAGSLESELAAAAGDPRATARVARDIERNEVTLRNLRARLEELGTFTPARRAAIAAGDENAPQYLEQAARLFSKGGADEEDVSAPPTRPPRDDEGEAIFDRGPEEVEEAIARRQRGVDFNNEQEGRYTYNEVYVEPANQEIRPRRAAGRSRPPREDAGRATRLRVDSYRPGTEAGYVSHGPELHERYAVQLADSPDAALAKMTKIVEDYQGARVAPVESSEAVLAAMAPRGGREATRITGRMVLIVPEQHAPVPQHLLEFAERNNLVIRDRSGREYTTLNPSGEDLPTVQPHSPTDDAEALYDALLRHVPADQREAVGTPEIVVLRPDEYFRLTRSEHGPVVTLVHGETPIIVVREGTPIARLADEGPHLVQIAEGRAGKLTEEALSTWDGLTVDEQLDLYRTKIDLEIEAHEMIAESLGAELSRGGADADSIHADIARNERTLSNLRNRLEEVERIPPERRAAMRREEEPRPDYLAQPARLFSKDSTIDAGYEGQPALRGPRIEAEAGSPEALRQRHEEWVEMMRRNLLTPGTRPPMVEGEAPRPRRFPWHDNIESAYAEYNALVERYHGRREVGIYRNVDTGEYMVALGSAVNVRAPREALRQETVLHYHPDYGPSLFRGPSGTDLLNTAFAAREAGRPVTEFIEFNVPGQGRSRTAFTVTPVPDPSFPGGTRMRIDLEFIHPTTGEYVHQTFDSRREWSTYYNSRTAAFDPDGAVYWHLMRSLGLTDEQIQQAAARHRDPSEPAPPPPPFVPARGGDGNAIFGEGNPLLSAAVAGLYELQKRHGQLQRQLAGMSRGEQALEAKIAALAGEGTDAARERTATEARLAELRARAAAARNEADPILDRITARLAVVLPEVAHQLTMDVGELLLAIQRIEMSEGRRLDAKQIIEALRNRVRKGPFADLEGLIAARSLVENILAVQQMRDDIRQIAPDAVISVQRGGAFVAEVLGHGSADFPASIAVPKAVSVEGDKRVERRWPNIEAAIVERMRQGQRKFVIVDVYMGGHFLEELRAMAGRLRGMEGGEDIEIHTMWLRETHGYDELVTPHQSAEHPSRKVTREMLTAGVAVVAGERTQAMIDADLPDPVALLRAIRDDLPGVGLSVIADGLEANDPAVAAGRVPGTSAEQRERAASNLRTFQVWDYPVGIAAGDDMKTVFDSDSTRPIRIFNRNGEVIFVITVGMRIPGTTSVFQNTREILVHLLSNGDIPPEADQRR